MPPQDSGDDAPLHKTHNIDELTQFSSDADPSSSPMPALPSLHEERSVEHGEVFSSIIPNFVLGSSIPPVPALHHIASEPLSQDLPSYHDVVDLKMTSTTPPSLCHQSHLLL